jgi:hypothetical protein
MNPLDSNTLGLARHLGLEKMNIECSESNKCRSSEHASKDITVIAARRVKL